ncbi:PLP-dependent transferase [Daedalea quercina L-15889]|uniref:PLP-dependent transferase n=1 Tax=Daedalea quercina L-15889 TaxID=1314783 RepID=A0A165MZ37_9APHY|nr:PLP-dependent transferase [Daedalea quercina L-15889]
MHDTPPPAVQSLPGLGHSAKQFFQLDGQYTNLNHGTAGAIPRFVEDASQQLSAHISANVDRFLWFEYRPQLEKVREQIADLINADPSECVFVPNVSHGINTVLRNFEWDESDVLLVTSCNFKTISAATHYICDVRPYPTLSEFQISFPITRQSMLERFSTRVHSLKSKLKPTAKMVAVLDSIVATPGVLMPWKEMVEICKAEGVWSVVDAAHSIGQELDIDLSSAGPDFWVSSCSKWMYTKHGCAVLYVPKRNHLVIKSAFPTSLTYDHSIHYEHCLQSKFYWTETLDFTASLSIKSALEFRSFLGGEHRINQYCHELALAGGKRLAQIMNTHMLYLPEDPDTELFTANMVNVAIPLPGSIMPSPQVTLMFQDLLLNHHNVYATQFYHNGKWWTRASAQVYNEITDFEKLGRALLLVCTEIVRTVSEWDGRDKADAKV